MLAPRQDITQRALLALQAEVGGDIVGNRLYPIGPNLSALVPLEPTADLQRRWHVVQTHAQQEGVVEKELAKLKLDAYCPRESKMVRVNAVKHRAVKRSLLVGYVFAGFDALHEQWKTIVRMRGVLKLLMIDLRPVPILEEVMDRIRLTELERANDLSEGRRIIELEVDALVRIIQPLSFAGLFGFVTEIHPKQYEISVEVDIFGRKVPLRLAADHVEAV